MNRQPGSSRLAVVVSSMLLAGFLLLLAYHETGALLATRAIVAGELGRMP